MATDPSSLFLAAALAAGLVEGSSVLRHYRHALQRANDNDNDSDGIDNANNDSVAIPIPSVSVLAMHSILYGVASVPLGIVGASPGHVFLPNYISSTSVLKKSGDEGSNGNAVVESNSNNTKKIETEERTVGDVKMEHPNPNTLGDNIISASASSNIPIVGTGRGVGRILRQENSMKMAQTKTKRHQQLEMQSASRNKAATAINAQGTAAAVIKPPASNSLSSSRYIATLDGMPLPTRLAEAMRRSRCMFIGAAMVSYAITQLVVPDKQRERGSTSYYRLDNTSYNHGYHCHDQWINNNKSIRLWNKRIRNGKSIDEAELLERLHTNIIIAQQEMGGSAIHDVSSKILSDETYASIQEAVFRGIYSLTKWINLQLGRDLDEPPFSLVGQWKLPCRECDDTIEEINSISLEASSSEADPNNLEGIVNHHGGSQSDIGDSQNGYNAKNESSIIMSDTDQSTQKSSNAVWNVPVTAVGVLGTSIRHLLVSTYGVAAATIGQKGRISSDESADVVNDEQNDLINGDFGKDKQDGGKDS